MLVKNRYGGVQHMPDAVARLLIARGVVTSAEQPKPAKPSPKPRKSSRQEPEAEAE